MIVTEKNKGIYMPYTLDGTKLHLNNGALTLNLAAFERDFPVHLDISVDAAGAMVLGPADWYVAEVDIPPRAYEITAGMPDDFGFPQLSKSAKPLETDAVKLTLWALEV